MAGGAVMSYLGATIRRERSGWRAYVPRCRGQGRARYQNRDLETVKAWIRANAAALSAGDPVLGPAEAAEYRAATAALPPGVTLLDAARRAREAAPVVDGRKTVAEAVDEYLALMRGAGRRKPTLESYAWACRKLAGLADRNVKFLLPSEVTEVILRQPHPVTRDNVRRQLSGFFEWCIQAGYCSSNPCRAVPKLRKDAPEHELVAQFGEPCPEGVHSYSLTANRRPYSVNASGTASNLPCRNRFRVVPGVGFCFGHHGDPGGDSTAEYAALQLSVQ